MSSRRRRLTFGLAGLLLLVFLGAGKTGWLSAPRQWEEATGWSKIPLSERPGTERLAGRGEESPPQVQWLGHSGFLIRWKGTTILVDPNTSGRCTISRRVLAASIDLSEIGPVDAVLISHAHFDHLDMPSIRALSSLANLVVPRGAETYFDPEEWAATRIHSLRQGDALVVGELEVIAVPAAHNGSRAHPLASPKLAVGYVVRFGSEAIYYAGDTGFRNDFAAIRDDFHPRVAILPIGAYAPRFPMERYHLNPEQAVEVAKILDVETVVPCHFGTFTLSLDRPDAALPRFAHAAAEAGVEWVMSVPLDDEPVRAAAR